MKLRLATLLLLGACTATPHAPGPKPQARATQAPAPDIAYDGYYRGTRTLINAEPGRTHCGPPENSASMTVYHGVAILRLVMDRHPIVFHAPLSPAGALVAEFNGNTVNGTFGATGFDGQVLTRYCTYSIHTDRS